MTCSSNVSYENPGIPTPPPPPSPPKLEWMDKEGRKRYYCAAWSGVEEAELKNFKVLIPPQIYFSTFNGQSWSKPEPVPGASTSNQPVLMDAPSWWRTSWVGPQLQPQLSSIHLLMAWKGRYNEQIYFSTFNGQSWSIPAAVPGAFTSTQPSLSKQYSTMPCIMMAWKGMGDDERIFYSRFNGQKWDSPTPIPGAFTSNQPSLSDLSLYVNIMAWKGKGDDQAIYFSLLDPDEKDPSKAWTTPKKPILHLPIYTKTGGYTSEIPSLGNFISPTIIAWAGAWQSNRISYQYFEADGSGGVKVTPVQQLPHHFTSNQPSLGEMGNPHSVGVRMMVWKSEKDNKILYMTFDRIEDDWTPDKPVPGAFTSNQPTLHFGMMVWSGKKGDQTIYFSTYNDKIDCWWEVKPVPGAFTSNPWWDSPYSRPALRYVNMPGTTPIDYVEFM